MRCRVAKKVCKHFWSRFFDPDNPRHRISTVRKAVRIYEKPLRFVVKVEHDVPRFEWIAEDRNPFSGLSFTATAVYLNGELLGTCQHFNTIPGEKKDGE